MQLIFYTLLKDFDICFKDESEPVAVEENLEVKND